MLLNSHSLSIIKRTGEKEKKRKEKKEENKTAIKIHQC